MKEKNLTKGQKMKRMALDIVALLGLGAFNYICIPGLVTTIQNMMQSGITVNGLFNATILSSLTIIPDFIFATNLGIKIHDGIKNRNKEKNNEQNNDVSQKFDKEISRAKEKDDRFLGKQHPIDVKRQPPREFERPRDDSDSREP